MRIPRSALLSTGLVALLALGGCGKDQPAQPPAAASKEPSAATVNGMPISERAVELVTKQATEAGRPASPDTRKAVIDQLALQMLAADEAVKKGLDKTPEMTEQLLLIRQSLLAQAYVQDYVKSNPVTDEMLKAEYERVKTTAGGTEYKARHILVAAEAEAKAIVAQLRKNPGAFAKLAAEKSKDPGSKGQGGDLGWFDPRRMVPEFGAAVAKLEKGKFTEEPVKTQFGYHVILLEDSRPIEPPPFDQVKSMLSTQVQQQNLVKQLESLKSSAKIEIAAGATPPAAAPAAPSPAPAAATPANPAPAAAAPGAAPAK
jgi:peptidyl-prolyl cis-trans isomerase C